MATFFEKEMRKLFRQGLDLPDQGNQNQPVSDQGQAAPQMSM